MPPVKALRRLLPYFRPYRTPLTAGLLLVIACGPGSEVKTGRELYLAYGCAACHGENADGKGFSAPLSTIKPRDLRDVQRFAGAKTAEGIAATIAFGVAEGRTGMPAYPDIPKRERMAIADAIGFVGSTSPQDHLLPLVGAGSGRCPAGTTGTQPFCETRAAAPAALGRTMTELLKG